MVDERRFSRPGDVPTEYEVGLVRKALLTAAVEDRYWMPVARSLFRQLGPALGTRALLIVLDSVGGEKVRTPRRDWLLGELERDALIDQAVAMAAQRATPAEISKAVGRSKSWVRKHLRRRARQEVVESSNTGCAA